MAFFPATGRGKQGDGQVGGGVTVNIIEIFIYSSSLL
jgi:hypothetical protein